MDSIKWKCKNWIVYFKIFDNFHFIHLIVEKLNVFNFHPIFSIVITNFTFTCEIWTRFLKNIHQKWKYYREEKQGFVIFLIFLIFSKCWQKRIKLNSVRSLWLCGEKNSHRRCSVKKVFLEISQNSQENISVTESLF